MSPRNVLALIVARDRSRTRFTAPRELWPAMQSALGSISMRLEIDRRGSRRVGIVRLVVAMALAAVVSLGVFAPGQALADRGTEWEPGGVLYKFRYKYGQKTEERRKTVRQARASIAADDSGKAEKRLRRVQKKKKKKRVRVASLGGGGSASAKPKKRKSRSITGGGRVIWQASSRCLAGRLRSAIHHVARNYGRVRVSSTCRSRSRNRRVGGARRSKHLTGNAADFRVYGNVRAAARYLRSVAGGYKHYGGGRFHIDTGPRRTW